MCFDIIVSKYGKRALFYRKLHIRNAALTKFHSEKIESYNLI